MHGWAVCVCGEGGEVVESFLLFREGAEVEAVIIRCAPCDLTWEELLEGPGSAGTIERSQRRIAA